MTMHTIYTAGYAKMDPRTLHALAEGLDCTVVDIRGRPISRRPGFGKRQLEALLGPRYTWWGDHLGGVYHLPNAEKLWPQGCRNLVSMMTTEKLRPLLLCQCHAPGGCHRHQVAKVLMGLGAVQVVHIYENETVDAAALERVLDTDDEYLAHDWTTARDIRDQWEG